MKAEIKIPDGWVRLKTGAKVRVGDRCLDDQFKKWIRIDKACDLCNACAEETIIRKKKKIVEL